MAGAGSALTMLAATLVLGSGLFVLYVLALHPLLLGLLARLHRNPIQKREQWKTVSVILPVRDGAPWIERKLRTLLELDYPRELVEILVVSNGSQDATDEIVGRYTDRGVRLLRTEAAGKAVALNEGIARARGEILFLTDVRQILDRNCLRHLVACLGDPSVGVVSGELYILKGESFEEENIGLYWRYEKWIRVCLSRIDSVLGATGAIYAMRRELAAALPPNTLLDDVCLPLEAFCRGYRIVFEPEARAYDYPTSLRSEFYRKVRTLAGVYQVIHRYPRLLHPRTRMWFHFVSYKCGRLMLPFALLLGAAASVALPRGWRETALASQAAFYGLAILDAWVPDSWFVKRFSSLARTFTYLMAATLVAPFYLWRGGGGAWKHTEVRPAHQD